MQTHEERIASAGTYAGSVIAALSGLTLNEWGVIIGVLLAIGSFVANLWFKYHIIKIAKSQQQVHFDVD